MQFESALTRREVLDRVRHGTRQMQRKGAAAGEVESRPVRDGFVLAWAPGAGKPRGLCLIASVEQAKTGCVIRACMGRGTGRGAGLPGAGKGALCRSRGAGDCHSACMVASHAVAAAFVPGRTEKSAGVCGAQPAEIKKAGDPPRSPAFSYPFIIRCGPHADIQTAHPPKWHRPLSFSNRQAPA